MRRSLFKTLAVIMTIAAIMTLALFVTSCSIKDDPHDKETTTTANTTGEQETTATSPVDTSTETTEAPTEEATEAHIHAFGEWSVTTAATCTEKGTETRTCACGETETRDIEALGHQEVSDDTVAVEPTCFTTGMTVGTHCERCGAVVKAAEEIPAAPHEYDDYQRCSRCGTIAGLRYDSKGDGTCWLVHPTDDGHGNVNEKTGYEDYGFTVEGGVLYIPSVSPDGEKVVALGDCLFACCPSILHIIVPDGVTVGIGSLECPNIVSAYIPANTDMTHAMGVCGQFPTHPITVYTAQESTESWDSVWWGDIGWRDYGRDEAKAVCGVSLEQYLDIIG